MYSQYEPLKQFHALAKDDPALMKIFRTKILTLQTWWYQVKEELLDEVIVTDDLDIDGIDDENIGI